MPRPALALLLCLFACAAQAADSVESVARKLDGLARQGRSFTQPELERLFGVRLKPGSCSPSGDYHDARGLTDCSASAALAPGRDASALYFDWTGVQEEPVVFEHVRLVLAPPGCKSAEQLAQMLGRKLTVQKIPPMKDFFGGIPPAAAPTPDATLTSSAPPPPPPAVMRQIRYSGFGASTGEPSVLMSFSEEAGCTRGIELSWTSAAYVAKIRGFLNSIAPPRN